MKLKSFGCSFMFGCDLSDPRDPGWASNVSWPALLAKELERKYHCHAWPGTGNMYTAKCILEQAEYAHNDLFVIGWTWIDRFDYIDPVTAEWATVLPGETRPQTELYYKNFHSQYYDKLLSLMAISNVINKLKEKHIPYIMTYMDKTLFETNWHCDSVIAQLQQDVQPSMTLFDNLTFLEWSKEKGFPISETLHPLEQAHRAGFELMKLNLDTILHKA